MMVLSRLWYVVLAILLGIATYVVFLAVGEYDRRNGVAMGEELASDSQIVGWALQIDARKRLDALLLGAVDKGVQDSLQAATGKDTIPGKSREDGRRALTAVSEKIPADFRPDAIFEVDHDGRVVSQIGYDAANAFPDFELGGYPAVFDALHGYLRDDTWVLGGRAYRVSARPVEADATQPPLGALVALKAVDKKFADDISKRTRANVAFFAAGSRIATSMVPGFDEARFTAIDSDMVNITSDKGFTEGRSDLRLPADDLGAIYARMVGDAWELGAGFVVVRTKTTIGGPLGFLNGADDKDKQSVNLVLIGAVVLGGLAIGLLLSWLEHSLPLRQMVKQSAALRRGELDYFQIARFRGPYRGAAENINAGIERVVEKGGGAARKPADLESILGPVPAQPAMSAFSFPMQDGSTQPPQGVRGPAPFQPPMVPPGPAHPPMGHMPPAAAVTAQQQGGSKPHLPPPAPPPRPRPPVSDGPVSPTAAAVAPPPQPTHPRASGPAFPPPGPPIPAPAQATQTQASATTGSRGNFQIALDDSPDSVDGDGPTLASALSPTGLNVPPGFDVPPGFEAPTMAAPQAVAAAAAAMGPAKGKAEPAMKLGMGGPTGRPAAAAPHVGTQTMMGIGLQPATVPQMGVQALPNRPADDDHEEESTVIAKAPTEILAQATGPAKAVTDETAEWMNVYDEFLRTKKQCEEPTDGLSFEKFQNTLRKNRDALVQRHNCKRVRFSVYIKDGRASLKATPVKE